LAAVEGKQAGNGQLAARGVLEYNGVHFKDEGETRMSTLVIVDMQGDFPAAHWPNVIEETQHQIRLAKLRRDGIILVRYVDSGSVMEPLLNAIGDYPWKVTAFKKKNDGSREVMRAIQRNRFDSTRIRVCGVNTGFCVLATIKGLLEWEDLIVEVVKSGCGDAQSRKNEGWGGYPKKQPRLVVI
jgi:nicotinamidase-related amidase